MSTIAFAIDEDGVAYVWGGSTGVNNHKTNAYPQLFDGLPSLKSKVIDLSCGLGHTLFLIESGSVYSWGNGGNGRLGLGDTSDRSIATLISSMSDEIIVSIQCGASHSLALTGSGSVYTWGKNTQGQCGVSHTDDVLKPKMIRTLPFNYHVITQLAAGWEHSLALTEDGKVFSWGSGYKDGRRSVVPPVLGLGYNEIRHTPNEITSLLGIPVAKIASGWDHCLALDRLGKVLSWGSGQNGKLGQNSEENYTIPCFIRSLDSHKIVNISAGCEHSAAITDKGELFMWGHGDGGRLGLGDNNQCSVPTTVSLFKKMGLSVYNVYCGDKFTIAITKPVRSSDIDTTSNIPVNIPISATKPNTGTTISNMTTTYTNTHIASVESNSDDEDEKNDNKNAKYIPSLLGNTMSSSNSSSVENDEDTNFLSTRTSSRSTTLTISQRRTYENDTDSINFDPIDNSIVNTSEESMKNKDIDPIIQQSDFQSDNAIGISNTMDRTSPAPSYQSLDHSVASRWYYECTLLTDGLIQIGWASSQFRCDPLCGQGVGDNYHSWAFDGLRSKKWNVSCESYGKRWKVGDVVGTLLDMDLLEIRFYVNGEDLGPAYDKCSQYDMYPAISLNVRQTIRVNFGSYRFMYPPDEIDKKPFQPVCQAIGLKNFSLRKKSKKIDDNSNSNNNDLDINSSVLDNSSSSISVNWNNNAITTNRLDERDRDDSDGLDINYRSSKDNTDRSNHDNSPDYVEMNRQQLIENLIAMGFPIDWALRAVENCHDNISESLAIAWIIEQMENKNNDSYSNRGDMSSRLDNNLNSTRNHHNDDDEFDDIDDIGLEYLLHRDHVLSNHISNHISSHITSSAVNNPSSNTNSNNVSSNSNSSVTMNSPGSVIREELVIGSNFLSIRNTSNKKWSTARINVPMLSGVHRWEVHIDRCISKNIFIGICSAEAKLDNYCGCDVNGWAFLANKAIWHNKTKIRTYGELFKTNDNIGIELDLDKRTLSFILNGYDLGVAVLFEDDMSDRPYYPAFSLYNEDDQISIVPSRLPIHSSLSRTSLIDRIPFN
eukprot:gene18786-24553_t